MTRRRVGLVLAPLLLLAACSGGPVTLTATTPAGTAATACRAFTDDLPTTLVDKAQRETTPSDALGRAWGDPAITITCGGPLPLEYAPGASCEVANGVGWFVPQEEYDDQEADATLTTVGYRPVVNLTVPHDYRPDGVAAALAELAATVKANLKLVQKCS